MTLAAPDITTGDVLAQALERSERERLFDLDRWSFDPETCFDCCGRGWIVAPLPGGAFRNRACPRCGGTGVEAA